MFELLKESEVKIMSVRQYIGARYVPKFYEHNNGVWESNTEYEPLTIVQYNSNSYTSKKTVPANIGNPSENPNYWVVTGNYNAQVENYRQEVENYKEQCDDYAEKSLNGYKSTNKNVLLFSDSYGMSDGQGGWCSKATSLLTGMGYTCEYLARSGYGFVGNDGTFLSEITDYANNMTTAQKRAITDLVIGGGWNDSGKTSSDIIAAMNTCLNYCKTTFPNAKIWVAFMAFDTQYLILNNLMINTEPDYRTGALQNGCFYMSNLPYITHNTNNMVDTRHPNDTGYTLISKMVVEYLINGESNADLIRVPMNIDLIEGIDNPDISNAYQHAHNGIVESFMYSFKFSIQSGVLNLQFDSAHPVKIADVKGCVVGDPLNTACVDVPCVLKLTEYTDLIYATIRFIIKNNELHILPLFNNQIGSNTTHECTTIYSPLIRMFTNMTIS